MWTDERVELLKKLWADGLSATQVAAELGGFADYPDGGRSAVCGKVHRLGLSGRAKSPSMSAPQPRVAHIQRRTPFRPPSYGSTGVVRAYSSVVPKPKRYYGPSNFVSSQRKREMGLDEDREIQFGGKLSPFPAPCAELPRESIHFLAARLYPSLR